MTCEMSWQTPLPLRPGLHRVGLHVRRAREVLHVVARRTGRPARPASCGCASPTASRAAATTSSSMAVSGVGASSSPNCSRTSRAASALQPDPVVPGEVGAGLDDRRPGDHQLRVRAVQVERGDRGAPVVAVGVGGGRRLDLDPGAQRRLPVAVLRRQPGLVVGGAHRAAVVEPGAVHDLQPPPVRGRSRGRRRLLGLGLRCGLTRPPPAPTPAAPAR